MVFVNSQIVWSKVVHATINAHSTTNYFMHSMFEYNVASPLDGKWGHYDCNPYICDTTSSYSTVCSALSSAVTVAYPTVGMHLLFILRSGYQPFVNDTTTQLHYIPLAGWSTGPSTSFLLCSYLGACGAVPVVHRCAAVVAMLLLLLAGDVETNPGPPGKCNT